jgi:undecaprenol kinase
MTDPSPWPNKPKTWRGKFYVAWRGWKFGIRGHSSFFVHFFTTAAVLCAAAVLQVGWLGGGLLVLCVGLVLTTEFLNSAVEEIHRGLDPESRARTWRALDIAAGAVLCASVTAALVGALIFAHRLVELYGSLLGRMALC